MMVLHESSAYKGFTHIGNTLIAQIVREFKPVILAFVQTFTPNESKAFRIPRPPVSVQLLLL